MPARVSQPWPNPDVRCRMTEVRDRKSKAKIPVRAPTSALPPPLRQRLVQKLAELRQVNRHLPDRGRGGGRTADIVRAPVLGADLVEHPLKENVDEHPSAHIARLLLAPEHFGLFEARQLRHHRLGREWIELLDAQQIDVVDAAAFPLLVKVVIDLAGTEDDAPDLV